MRKGLTTVLIAVIVTGVVSIGVALAAELEIVPGTPDPGEAELTIKVSGFEGEMPIYVLPWRRRRHHPGHL